MKNKIETWFIKENASIEFNKGKITFNTLADSNDTAGKKYQVKIQEIK